MKIAILENQLPVSKSEWPDKVQELGFSTVELQIDSFTRESHPILHASDSIQIQQWLQTKGIEIASVSLLCWSEILQELSAENEHPATIEWFQGILQRAAAFAIPILHIPIYPHEKKSSKQYQQLIERSIVPWHDHIIESHIEIALDLLLPAEDLKELVEKLAKPWLRISYDTGNHAAAGRDIFSDLSLLREHIIQVRLKDRMRQPPFSKVPLSEDNLPMSNIMDHLHAVGFQGTLVVELPWGTDPSSSLQYLQKHLV